MCLADCPVLSPRSSLWCGWIGYRVAPHSWLAFVSAVSQTHPPTPPLHTNLYSIHVSWPSPSASPIFSQYIVRDIVEANCFSAQSCSINFILKGHFSTPNCQSVPSLAPRYLRCMHLKYIFTLGHVMIMTCLCNNSLLATFSYRIHDCWLT